MVVRTTVPRLALEVKGKLEAAQHAQLVSTLLGTLTGSGTPEAPAQNRQAYCRLFRPAAAPSAVDALEQTILQMAVRGLLVLKDPSDEPASVLLRKIRAKKNRLILEGRIKYDKPFQPIADEKKPFELPVKWEWVHLERITARLSKWCFQSWRCGQIADEFVKTDRHQKVFLPPRVKFLLPRQILKVSTP